MIENNHKSLSPLDPLFYKIAKLVEKIINFTTKLGDDDINVEGTRSLVIEVPSWVIGNIYHLYKNVEERFRVWLYNFIDKVVDLRIFYEILYHSRSLLLVLIILLFGSFAFFLFGGGVINVVDKNLITTLLTTYVGGATAILCIVFALYSVGFQTTTERFSSIVTDYLNREKVGQFFFKLLALTAVFSLFNLLLQQGAAQPVVPPFIISTFLITSSLLGILVFKDDYMTKLKPKQVFERIYWQNIDAIRLVNLYDYPKVKSFRLAKQSNVKSFKLYLPIHSSWSIIGNLQKQVDDRLDILESFFRDLRREQRIEDATFGIVSSGYFLAEYLSIKHFIEKGYGWWFPTYQEVVTAESVAMFPIKANYEAMGVGRLGIDKKNEDWLENRIVNFLKQIQTNTDFKAEPLIGNALISAYEVILAGRYVKTNKGYEKELKGAYENNDYVLTDKVLSLFEDLGEKLTEVDKCRGNFINSFGQIKTTIIDGFSNRSFPGKLEDWKSPLTDKFSKLTNGQYLTATKQDIISWKQPALFHSLLFKVQEQLKVEYDVENKIITPKQWLIDDAIKKAKTTEQQTVEKYRKSIVTSIIKLAKLPNGQFYRDYFGGVILGIFNQLIYQDRWAELELFVKEHSIELFVYFSSIDQKEFLEQELREPIDLGVFEALTARNKVVYYFYLRLFLLAQNHIVGNIADETDTEKLLKTIRRP